MSRNRLPKSFLNELESRIDIIDHASRLLDVKKKGRDYFANCIFHEEKSDSLSFSQEKQFFHCFGCGEHGGVITLHMRATGLDFMSTVHALAEEYHIEMPTPENMTESEDAIAIKNIKKEAKLLFSNISFACSLHTPSEYEKKILSQIEEKWSAFTNVTPIWWGGSEYADKLLTNTTKERLLQAITYCGVNLSELKKPTALLTFTGHSDNEIVGLLTPGGEVWSQNPDIPLIGINKISRGKTDAIEVFIAGDASFQHIPESRHISFMNRDNLMKIRSLSKAALLRYSEKIIFHIPERLKPETKELLGTYKDGDLLYVTHDFNSEPQGLITYLRNLLSSRLLLALHEAPERQADLERLLNENMVDLKIRPDQHRFASLMLKQQVLEFVRHAITKNHHIFNNPSPTLEPTKLDASESNYNPARRANLKI